MEKTIRTFVSKATLEDLKKEMKRRGLIKTVKYWETRTGEKVDITEMSDTHLVNTVRMLERNQALEDMYREIEECGFDPFWDQALKN